ncbi:MAG: Fur family transcriptional regulator [Candidatus Aminicenantes bacterium]
MKRTPEDLRRMMDRFEAAIREAGVKRTPQRIEIYRQTAAREDHPDIETIHRKVRKTMPCVSLDTVYRTLGLFRELGLVSNVRTLSGHPRFDANTAPHHHFVCTRCGLTRDFTDPGFDALKVPEAARALGRAESARLEVRGLCPACAAAGNSARTKGTRFHRIKKNPKRRD